MTNDCTFDIFVIVVLDHAKKRLAMPKTKGNHRSVTRSAISKQGVLSSCFGGKIKLVLDRRQEALLHDCDVHARVSFPRDRRRQR
jgi:hypothetical protein